LWLAVLAGATYAATPLDETFSRIDKAAATFHGFKAAI